MRDQEGTNWKIGRPVLTLALIKRGDNFGISNNVYLGLADETVHLVDDIKLGCQIGISCLSEQCVE